MMMVMLIMWIFINNGFYFSHGNGSVYKSWRQTPNTDGLSSSDSESVCGGTPQPVASSSLPGEYQVYADVSGWEEISPLKILFINITLVHVTLSTFQHFTKTVWHTMSAWEHPIWHLRTCIPIKVSKKSYMFVLILRTSCFPLRFTYKLTLEQHRASLQLELIADMFSFNELSKDWHTNLLSIYIS